MYEIIGPIARCDERSKRRHAREDVWDPLRDARALLCSFLNERLEALTRDIVTGVQDMLAIEHLIKKDKKREQQQQNRDCIAILLRDKGEGVARRSRSIQ